MTCVSRKIPSLLRTHIFLIIDNYDNKNLSIIFSAKGRITYADVERYVMTHGDVYAEETEDILEAFRVLDKYGSGKISVKDFKRCMTTMGDRMTLDEVEEIIKYAKSDGFIEYEGRQVKQPNLCFCVW